MEDDRLNAVVTKRVEVAPGLIILQARPDGWELPDFTPGQFAILGLPSSAKRYWLSDPEGQDIAEGSRMIKRPYSITTSSKNKEYLEFYITMIRSGQLTPRLFNLLEGDRFYMSPKFRGLFTIDMAPPEANIIMIATGTGLAPFMSMIRSNMIMDAGRRFIIIHGARHSWDLGYRAELSTLSYHQRNLTYIPVVSRPEDERAGWVGMSGYVQNVWTRKIIKSITGFQPKPEDTHIFVCGSPDMTDSTVKLLELDGFEVAKEGGKGQVHVEKYW
ncbi:MAG: ferredoxin--NADP reductase [Nitrospinae bacterium]|nr:ferredoxin--NADP reductase [Nitrospinota bacterium]